MALQFVAPALSFVALSLGYSLEWPRLAAVGVVGLGLAGIALGQFAIRERRVMFIRGGSMTPRAYRYFLYEGVAAVPFGLAFVIAGVGVIVPAVLAMLGASVDTIRDTVLARPGLVLVPVGVILLFNGAGLVIGFRRVPESAGDRFWLEFLHLPALLGGAILVAIGMAAVLIGLFELLVPDTFDRMWERIRDEPSALFR